MESTRSDHRQQADALLAELRHHRGRAFRVGITGTPGVGKSTLIEAFGLHLCNDRSLRVAVLAVDPSSSRTGGSILGDKTRMAEVVSDIHLRTYDLLLPVERWVAWLAEPGK